MRRRGSPTLLASAAVLVGVACAGGGPGEGVGDPRTDPCVEGRVGLMPGPEPVPMVQGDTGRFVITGSGAADLVRLESVEVRVCGTVTGAEPMGRIEATGYTVVRVNGDPAWSGEVVRGEGGADEAALQLRTAEGDLTLTGPVERLWEQVGSTIWITGEAADGRVRVTAYGVIRSGTAPPPR